VLVMNKRALVGAAVAGAGVLGLTPGVAAADSWPTDTANTSGGHADCWVWSTNGALPDINGFVSCNVWDDDEGDSDSLYIDFQIDGWAVERAVECPADHDCELRNFGRSSDARIENIQWRVCRNAWPFGDPCSDWVSHHPNGVK
jgi:hypothetical protein